MNSGEPTLSAFAAVAGTDARLLILGSMPGVASLDAQEYYAHPRNAFWPIVQELFGTPPAPQTYCENIKLLQSAQIALWDVLANCKRPGSLDANIDPKSIVCNDFNTFLKTHNQVEQIAFNGKAAEKLFKKHVIPELNLSPEIALVSLPSSSPAMASLNLQQKTDAWRCALKT